MTRFAVALLAALPACVVYDTDHVVVEEPAPYVNYAPVINYAEAGCYWDGYYGDYIWYFTGDFDDPNGVYDVVSAWADVYDGPTGAWVDWLGSSTYVDCNYRGYEVDIVVYDSLDVYTATTVLPVYY